MMSKVELYAAIRRDVRAGMSGREVEPRTMSAGALFKPAVDEILRTDLDEPRKQRHTP